MEVFGALIREPGISVAEYGLAEADRIHLFTLMPSCNQMSSFSA
jgi:hypothetical protein